MAVSRAVRSVALSEYQLVAKKVGVKAANLAGHWVVPTADLTVVSTAAPMVVKTVDE